MKTLIFDVFHVFRYTWFTMEALEDTWENLQKIIEVCNLTSEICLFYSNQFCANSSDYCYWHFRSSGNNYIIKLIL